MHHKFLSIFIKKIMRTFLLLFILFFSSISLSAQEKTKAFFVFLNSRPDKEVLDSTQQSNLQKQHLANIDRLYKEGKIKAAGPFYGGGGLFVVEEVNKAKVYELLNTDPAIAAKRFILEVYPLRFIYGSIGEYTEPIEMTSYSFIRIQKAANKHTESRLRELMHRFSKDVITAAVFPDHSGGFLVLKTNFSKLKEQIDSTKGISIPALTLKQIYIAKGSFRTALKK
jgi:uncharacterized protein YciI